MRAALNAKLEENLNTLQYLSNYIFNFSNKTVGRKLRHSSHECKMNAHRWNRNNKTSKTVHNSGVQKALARKPLPKPHETEEEAIIRRFHDAQRMARFRAKRKKALQEAKAIEAAGFNGVAVISELKRRNITFEVSDTIGDASCNKQFQACLSMENPSIVLQPGRSKYSQLLAVIEELGKDIRLTYAGSRTSAEKLKIGIVQAKMLVKDCLLETEINSQL